MNKQLIILCGLALSGNLLTAFAQRQPLNPPPRELVTNHKERPCPTSFRLIGEGEANSRAVRQVKRLLGEKIGPDGFPIYIGEKDDKAVKPFRKRIPNREEGYYLSIGDNRIVLAGNDERGTFYAVQTLKQWMRNGVAGDSLTALLHEVEIKDYPDIRFRGVVEGFYGTPWTHENRLRQLRFYGEHKLNTYIYGPKDDPYHSTPHWRIPYPEKEARNLSRLIETARENEVDFVWAIHPGQDIQWNEADRAKIMEKFEHMYRLGTRSFAIFFDDISGEGTNADRQAELLNYLDDHFVKAKGDVGPLIMCPTEYNKSWAKPEGGYLKTLGEKLNPGIQVMWTGDRVVADMTSEGLDWIGQQIRRPAYVWWNFPVSDYVRDHLLMGAVYGNEKGIGAKMSGFVANPMERAEASKIALYGVASYTWNTERFDSQRSWEEAATILLPDAAEAMFTFCRHNSDLGPNGHGYRRVESTEIRPYAERALQALRSGRTINTDDFIRLKREFEKIIESANLLLTSESNPALLAEIKPWIRQFGLLGHMGSEALALNEALGQQSEETFKRKYKHLKALQKLSYEIDQTENQNPYQPGVKTGSKILMPLIDTLFITAVGQFNREHGTQLSITTRYSPHSFASNMAWLSHRPLQTKNRAVSVTPPLEVVKWSPGGYIEFTFDKTYPAFEPIIDFGQKETPAWGKLEVSADGRTWQTVTIEKGMKPMPVKAIRFSNAGDKEEEIRLKRFAIRLPE